MSETTPTPLLRHRARWAALLLCAAALLLAACSGAGSADGSRPAPPDPPSSEAAAGDERGQLVSSEPLVSLDRQQARTQLRRGSWGGMPVRSGVEAHRITYATVDDRGEPVTASGVLAVPSDATEPLTPVAYTHGTLTYRGESPSVDWADPYANGPILAIAGAGFAAVAPDYVGLGTSTGPHPWLHSATEASATLDLVTASRAAAARLDLELAGETHLIGFSQGASAALATAAAAADGDTRIGSVFAISGAYDFAGTELPALLDGRVPPPLSVAYVSLMLVSWDRSWDLYDDPSEVFRSPYSGRVERLFDGGTPGDVMLRSLPPTLDELLTPRGLQLLRDPSPALRRALEHADDVCRWPGDRHVVLLRAADDEQAVAANTTVCAERLRAAGHSVEVVDLGRPSVFGSRHLGTNVAGTELALDRLRR